MKKRPSSIIKGDLLKDAEEHTIYDDQINELMHQIIVVKKLSQLKGPQLSSLKRATEKGEKCCGGTFPHTHSPNKEENKNKL